MISNDVKLLRLQHTDASVYDGPLWTSSLSARSALIWGGISANSLFFTSTTAVCVSVTSSQLKVLGAISITGDSLTAPQHLFQVCNSAVDSLFMVTTGGKVGIGTGAGTVWDIAEDPTNLLVIKDGNQLIQDGNFRMKQITELCVDFNANAGTYNFYNLSDTKLRTQISPSNDPPLFTLSNTGNFKNLGDVHLQNRDDYTTYLIASNNYNVLSITGGMHIHSGDFTIKSGSTTAVKYDQVSSKLLFYNTAAEPIIEIDPNSSFDRLSISGNAYFRGDVSVDGSKNFKITHPDPKKKDYYLTHSSLEGPEVGVYWRTRVEFSKDYIEISVNFPDYWKYLVEKNSTQIFLTSKNNVYVKKILENKFFLKRKKKSLKKEFVDCLVFGTRITEKKFQLEELKGK